MAEPLIITAGGTFKSGTYSTCSIRTTAPVVLDGINFVGPGDIITSNTRPSLLVQNCKFNTPAPHYSVVLWSFKSFAFLHNSIVGSAGCVMMDQLGPDKVSILYNDVLNINGVDPTTQTRTKCSAFQVDQTHCADFEVAWNKITNEVGKSAVEDVISLNRSGGLATTPPTIDRSDTTITSPGTYAFVHDNLVDGSFQWPRPATSFSGSCLMLYDPAEGSNLDEGGYTVAYRNIALDSDNAGVDGAGSKNLWYVSNIYCNDGIASQIWNIGMRSFNWSLKTQPAAFGPFFAYGNESYCKHGTPFEFAAPQTTASGNTSPVLTEAACRELWAARAKAAGVVVGPT